MRTAKNNFHLILIFLIALLLIVAVIKIFNNRIRLMEAKTQVGGVVILDAALNMNHKMENEDRRLYLFNHTSFQS